MSRFRRTAIPFCLLALLLTGCWDVKDLQEINYLTAIGFDLEGDEIVVYGQMLDFASVAKAEAGKSSEMPVWVGKGRGRTLIEAIDDLYRSSQLRIFYGHVNAVVLGEKLLENRAAMKQVYEFQSRFYEMRYTPWMFGTAEEIEEVLSATSIFGTSPGLSILHQPLETYKQRSLFLPISVRRFTLDSNEPGRTVLLPSIAVSDGNWSKGDKPQEMLLINGAYALKEKKLLGWFRADEMKGMAWVAPETYRGPLVLDSGGDIIATLSLEQPNIRIHPRVRDGKAEYVFKVELSARLVMSLQPQSESELEKAAEEIVRRQIREVYEKGAARGADLLRLETAMYRKENRAWHRLGSRGGLELTPESLAEIDVAIDIDRTGNMKGPSND